MKQLGLDVWLVILKQAIALDSPRPWPSLCKVEAVKQTLAAQKRTRSWLARLASVCREFTDPCQHLIFSNRVVILNKARLERFFHAIGTRADLAGLVTHIVIGAHKTEELERLLKPLINLQSLTASQCQAQTFAELYDRQATKTLRKLVLSKTSWLKPRAEHETGPGLLDGVECISALYGNPLLEQLYLEFDLEDDFGHNARYPEALTVGSSTLMRVRFNVTKWSDNDRQYIFGALPRSVRELALDYTSCREGVVFGSEIAQLGTRLIKLSLTWTGLIAIALDYEYDHLYDDTGLSFLSSLTSLEELVLSGPTQSGAEVLNSLPLSLKRLSILGNPLDLDTVMLGEDTDAFEPGALAEYIEAREKRSPNIVHLTYKPTIGGGLFDEACEDPMASCCSSR